MEDRENEKIKREKSDSIAGGLKEGVLKCIYYQ